MSRTTRTARRHLAAPVRHRIAVGAAVVLVAAAAAGCTAEPDEPVPTPTALPPLLEDQDARVQVEPGSYVATPFDAPAPAALVPVLQVPEGYRSTEGAGLWAIDEEAGDRVVGLWDIRSVYTHPCDADGFPKPVGPSVADLADALADQPMRDGTDPVATTIGGYDGLYVELSTPADLDLATCRGGYFHSWPGRSDRAPGATDLLWIVDVDGQRIAFNASYPSTASPEEVAELEEIVTSTTFVRPER